MKDSTLARLGEFRQLKNEIRGSDKHLIIGIDVAKEKHYAFFGTATGKTLLRRLIFNKKRRLKKGQKRLKVKRGRKRK